MISKEDYKGHLRVIRDQLKEVRERERILIEERNRTIRAAVEAGATWADAGMAAGLAMAPLSRVLKSGRSKYIDPDGE